ncbi:MAG: MMPL family transporter [Alphaproteobacteria bacterium]|nr:MMPL family transporter [Alphaproteobacteria bacterium]MDP6818880.1 MMPL family transporter [Alphaproteobacteria bacterium]
MTSLIAQTYDNMVLRHPILVLVVLFSVVVFFGYHTKDFRLDASADSLLLDDDEDLKTFRKIHQRYPSGDLLVVTYSPDKDLFSDQALETLRLLREDLRKVAGVDSIFTILDAPLLKSSDKSFTEMITDIPSLDKPDIDRGRAREELLNSPIYRELIISVDGRTTALLIELAEDERYNSLRRSRSEMLAKRRGSGLTDEEAQTLNSLESEYIAARDGRGEQRHLEVAQIRDILEPYRAHSQLYLGGVAMITDDMVTFVRNDLTVFGGGVLAFLIIVLTVIFRKLRWIVLPLLSCLYAVLMMMGVLGLIGWNVTVISSNFLALMLIITISMNIHLTVRYRQLRRDHPDDDQLALVKATTHKMVKPCLYTALTTIIGFGSLMVSDIKPVIDFGWMMSAGLAATFATSFLLFPTLLLVMGKTKAKPPVESSRFALPGHLARLTETQGNRILLLAVMLTAASAVGISQLRVENSFVNYFKSGTEIYQGLKLIDEKLGGTTPVEILIKFEDEDEGALTPEELAEMSEYERELELEFAASLAESPEYWFTPDKIQRIKEVHDYLDELPEIGKVLSLASGVRVAEEAIGEELDGMMLALLYTKVPVTVREAMIDPYVSIADNEARLLARVVDSKPDLRRGQLLEKINRDLVEKLEFDAQDVTVSGLLVLYNNMLQSLFSSQIKTIGVVMLGIAIMFLMLFRSVTLAIIGILPNLLGAAVVLGVMGWAKIPMDMMTITIAAITIGIAVDNGIHYIYRFREEYALTNSYAETLHICHSNIGKAVFYTTMTIICGFSILVFSNFIPTIYFGVLIAAAMFIALMAALTVLPKLILLWKPFG